MRQCCWVKRTKVPGKPQSGSSSNSRRYKYTKVLDNRKHAIRGLSRRNGSFVARITVGDNAVPMENTLMFAEALRKNRVPFALHIYEAGGHGMGLGNKNHPSDPLHPWTADALFWLKQHRFLNCPGAGCGGDPVSA